jgi:hypothetical protein
MLWSRADNHELSIRMVEASDPPVGPLVLLADPASPLVDWDSIEIQEEREKEGRVELCKEELVYVLSGLRREDEYAEQMAREAFVHYGWIKCSLWLSSFCIFFAISQKSRS